ncbi:MAG: hypothetical protein K2M79_04060 [Muribaculaceae bacterium]|nr:hypothetical protein [Muribaculaceae bacterium]
MKIKGFLLTLSALLCSFVVMAQAAGAPTLYSWDECQGSLRPYPTVKNAEAYPDSLQPVFINHVGRHGARFPASASNTQKLHQALESALEQGTITPVGRKLMAITTEVLRRANNNWGALDSLGMAEQRAIASRMYRNFKPVFAEGVVVNAISSYSPRVMMSMYSFTHQLDRMSNKMEFVTSTGRMNSALMRPFDVDKAYIDWRKEDESAPVYNEFFDNVCPTDPIVRALGNSYALDSESEKKNLSLIEYYVLAGLEAMGMSCDAGVFFTPAEYNALWSCFNLRQYLQRTATTLSMIPADIASQLLMNLINTTDAFIAGTESAAVQLRFGHAETLMPLLSLMRLKGCYYMTNYFDTVARHWCDFNVVPMAANLQMILFRAKKSGKYYLRTDLNETPVALIPNVEDIYIPWEQAKAYLLRCIPLYAQ